MARLDLRISLSRPPHRTSLRATQAHSCTAATCSYLLCNSSKRRGMTVSNVNKQPSALKREIFVYAPQLVGYGRMALLFAGVAFSSHAPLASYLLFVTNFVLDGLDGMLARRFNQVTQFGAFLDVAIDILSRGVTLALALPGPLSASLIILEAFTFVCTHSVSSGAWKTNYFASAPAWVSAVMKDGFKTPAGCLTIGGLMGLPLWLYARRFLPGTIFASPVLGMFVIAGRLLCASVECWVIASHLNALLHEDVAAKAKET